jgi:hypothetical protein
MSSDDDTTSIASPPPRGAEPGIIYIDNVAYYRAGRAMQVLNLSKYDFYRQAKEPWFPKRGYGRQHVYPVRDIDALAEAKAESEPQHAFQSVSGALVFSQSSPGDQREARDIALRTSGNGSEHTISSLSTRIELQKRNPDTFWSLKVRHKVAGYFSLLRLPPGAMNALLGGTRSNSSIAVAESLPFSRDEDFDLYVEELALDPDIPQHERTSSEEALISGFAGVLLGLLAQGYRLRAVYTVAGNQEALSLAQQIGFRTPEEQPARGSRTTCIFLLDEGGRQRLHELHST